MMVRRVKILDRPRFAMVVAAAITAVFVLAVLAPLPAAAQSANTDIFEVRGVAVDVTTDSVTQAREQGLENGRVAAFSALIERLVSPDDVARVPQPSASEIITMVRDFSIANERSSAVRYLADLTVRFHPGPVRALLRRANVPFTETVSKPLVVVPLYREDAGERLTLWEDPNPWRMAWMEPAADNSLVPFLVPLGDITDLTTISMEQASAGEVDALDALATRYGAGGTLVAIAEASLGDVPIVEPPPVEEGDVVDGDVTDWEPAEPAPAPLTEEDIVEGDEPAQVVNVLMTLSVRHGSLPLAQMVLPYSSAPGEAVEDALVDAAHAAADAVQNAWKSINSISYDSVTEITALVPLSGIDRWVSIKSELEAVPLVQRLDLQAMTRDRAQITLTYAGAFDQFNVALAQRDLALNQQSGVWVIEPVNANVVEALGVDSAEAGIAEQPAAPPFPSPPAVRPVQ
ncbi:MAG: DUF2066 domain-containing protein [Rhodospirillaceae bacterium]